MKNKKGCGCFTIIIFLILMGIGGAITMFQDSSIQKVISGVSDESEYITMEEYNQIKTGMSYKQVKKIIGSNGEVSSEVDSGGYSIKIITWYVNGSAGSNANVTFTNNEVSGKAQVGLK